LEVIMEDNRTGDMLIIKGARGGRGFSDDLDHQVVTADEPKPTREEPVSDPNLRETGETMHALVTEKNRPQLKETDLYLHSCNIFDTLGQIRDSPGRFIEKVDKIKEKHQNGKDKFDCDVKIEDEKLSTLKEHLKKISKQSVECIMWNENIFQNFRQNLELINEENEKSITSQISAEFPEFSLSIFTLFNYVDVDDSLLLILQNEELRKKILSQNYHYGAVVCGFNEGNRPLTMVILGNENRK